MDLQFGKGMRGAEATAAITARPGAPRVLIVTTYDTDADTLPAIEAGATGYLLKDAPPEELAAAVRTAAAGRTTLAPTVADRLMNRLRAPGAALTRRETEVLTLVADGLSNHAIGARLHLTEGTVKSHLARIYTKLGVDSRTAAVAAATATRPHPTMTRPNETHEQIPTAPPAAPLRPSTTARALPAAVVLSLEAMGSCSRRAAARSHPKG